jgi:hypothetical protein
LAHWVYLALKKVLSEQNIISAYRSTGIFNPDVVQSRMAPSEAFARGKEEEHCEQESHWESPRLN